MGISPFTNIRLVLLLGFPDLASVGEDLPVEEVDPVVLAQQPHAVVVAGIFFSRGISLTFHGHDMDQNRSFQQKRVLECLDKAVKTMAPNRTNIPEFKGLKEHARGKESDEGIFTLSDEIDDVFAHTWNGSNEITQLLPQMNKATACHFAAQEG